MDLTTCQQPVNEHVLMKEQPTHFRNSNFKHIIKRLQIPQKHVYEKFYVHKKYFMYITLPP